MSSWCDRALLRLSSLPFRDRYRVEHKGQPQGENNKFYKLRDGRNGPFWSRPGAQHGAFPYATKVADDRLALAWPPTQPETHAGQLIQHPGMGSNSTTPLRHGKERLRQPPPSTKCFGGHHGLCRTWFGFATSAYIGLPCFFYKKYHSILSLPWCDGLIVS